jgi:colanic acid/amylovoran biosynthesis glycosyltransferase
MNIAYVLADFPVFSETFVGDEIRAMQARGHAVVPIVLRAQIDAGQEADRELAACAHRLPDIAVRSAASAVRHTKPSSVRAAGFMRRQKMLPVRSLLGNALKIAAIASRHRSTHFHAHFAGGAAAHAIVAARFVGATVSFICHGHDVYSEPEDLPAKLSAADFVVATCEDMAADLRAMAPSGRILRSYCGIDPQKFQFRSDPEPNGKLLFIGRLVEQKGVDDIIHALAGMLPEKRASLDIVGDGPQRADLERLAREKGLLGSCVSFLGSKPRTWFIENGAHFTALVAPFKTGPKGERDSGPTVVKEAMAMGLPVIASRYMGVKEMLAPGTGLFVEPADIAGIRTAIEAAFAWSAEERLSLAVSARERILSHFTLEKQAAELSSFIEDCQEKIGSKSSNNSLKIVKKPISNLYAKYFQRA